MLTGIDISSYQRGLDLAATKPGFAIMKATEGVSLVDKYCDGWVSQCEAAGIPWGFYHFARTNGGAKEARYFYTQTKNYVGRGIPILDFEDARNPNSYIDEFVKEYHAMTGIFPWVYMNSDFINNRGYGSDYVKKNCGLWLAGYPQQLTTYPAGKECPYPHKGWLLAAWQFTSSLGFGGMSVDGDIFYGDTSAWRLYANPGGVSGDVTHSKPDAVSEAAWESQYGYARRIIDGEFGNGSARKKALGDKYALAQAAANVLLNGTDYQLAKLVIQGKMSNGADREWILGSRYANVQTCVNQVLR